MTVITLATPNAPYQSVASVFAFPAQNLRLLMLVVLRRKRPALLYATARLNPRTQKPRASVVSGTPFASNPGSEAPAIGRVTRAIGSEAPARVPHSDGVTRAIESEAPARETRCLCLPALDIVETHRKHLPAGLLLGLQISPRLLSAFTSCCDDLLVFSQM